MTYLGNTLEDIIQCCGAPAKLISDRAQVEVSNRGKDILRSLIIGDCQSEPEQQHQNPAEWHYQTVKTMANSIIDHTGSPAYTWLLALAYVYFILNHTAFSTIGWHAPLEVLTGSTPNISPLLRFQWWELIYYKVDDAYSPSESRELRGHFVGIAEHVGHAMMCKILTDDTQKVISRLNIRSALDPMAPNQCLDPIE